MSKQEDQKNTSGIEMGDPEQAPIKISIEHAESYLYSNVAGVSVSPMDIRIDFADVSADGKAKTMVGVTMSPEQAASFVLILMQQLRIYEAQCGPIRTPQWRTMRDTAMQQYQELQKSLKPAEDES